MSSQNGNGSKGISLGALARRPETGSLIGFIVVYIFFAVLGGPVFLGLPGWSSWLNIAAEVGIIALPVGLLMIAGEFDISVGSIVPAASMMTAMLGGHYDAPAVVAILPGLGVGLTIGLVNGLLVTRTTIPSLIVTIGVMFAVMGLTLGFAVLIKGSTSVSYVPDPLTKSLMGQFVKGFSVSIFWWLWLVAVFFYALHVSPWGNWIFAIGGDKESARNAGIPVNGMTILLYIMTATAASFVGMCHSILFNSAQVSGGMNDIFNIIVSVVVGGVLLTGGFGSVAGIFVGALTFAIVNKGIDFTAIDRNWSNLIIGIMLLLAVGMNEKFRKLALSHVSKKK